MKLGRRLVGVCVGIIFPLLVWTPALGAPLADNVDIQLSALRLMINDYTTRYQIKLVLTVTAESDDEVAEAETASLRLTNSQGATLELAPHKTQLIPRQFKAARGVAMFKVIEDASDPGINNVPTGFLSQEGPLQLELTILSDQYVGSIEFNTPVSLSVSQVGSPVENFTLELEHPFTVKTLPVEFGPVYYKKQDLTNFVFQMASMDQALGGGDFHAPVESPQYLFQVQVGDGEGGPARLVPPERYIDGFSAHMIRSEQTATPLHFQADEFSEGDVVIIDFQRTDTLAPDSIFIGPGENLTSRAVVVNRAIYALYVAAQPTPEELGQVVIPDE